MAASSPSIALPRNAVSKPASLDSNGATAWLPLMSILFGIVSLLYLAQTSELTTTGYGIQELQVEVSNWKLRNEQLALDLARASSLTVVEVEASERLKMVRPENLIYLEAGDPGQAQRAVMSSRGQSQASLVLVSDASSANGGMLTPVTNALSSLLAPRGR